MPESRANVSKIGAFLQSAETPPNTLDQEAGGGRAAGARQSGDLRTVFLRHLATEGPRPILALLFATGEASPYSQSLEAVAFLRSGGLMTVDGEPGNEVARLTEDGQKLAAVLNG